MIDDQLLAIVVCPRERTPLAVAEQELVARVNQAIQTGKVNNVVGRTCELPLDAGLINGSRTLLYPVIDGIPVLLVDEAIPLEEFDKT